MRIDSKHPLAALAKSAVVKPSGGGLVVGEAAGGPMFRPEEALERAERMANEAIVRGGKQLEALLAIETPSQPKGQHWRAKADKRKGQRGAAARAMKAWLEAHAPRLVITVIRVSPRRLDDPNLGEALKAVIDGFADSMRIDDGSPIVKWRLEQRQGPEARVEWSMRWQRPRVRKGPGSLVLRATP